MGFITVERHVFFVKPREYASGHNHLWVKNARVPMGRVNDRTIKYLDDAMFGALPMKIAGGSIDALRNFFMGKGHPFPKLIVANVTANDLYDREGMQKLMFQRWKMNKSGVPAGQSVNSPAFPKLEEEKITTHAERMAKYYAEDPGFTSRERSVGVHGSDHRPHFTSHPHKNEVWLFADPSRPGKVLVPKARGLILAKQVLDRNFKNVLLSTANNQRVMDMDSVIILGVAYRLDYRQNQVPVDAVSLEGIDSRVRKYFLPFLQKIDSEVDVSKAKNQGAIRTYYALGKKPLPSRKERWKPTPSGRVRKYSTFRKGKGFEPIAPGWKSNVVPLFTVKARNIDAARMSAQNMINRKRWSRDLKERSQWLDYGEQWYDNGREMITVGALRMLQGKVK